MQEKVVNENINTFYKPSSIEKKKALIMYFLFGILVMIGKSEMSIFEYYHLKQSIGWWFFFIVFFVSFVIFLFIPVVKIIGIFVLFILILCLGFFLKQTWDGKYKLEGLEKKSIQFFVYMGGWLLGLFEINPKIKFNA